MPSTRSIRRALGGALVLLVGLLTLVVLPAPATAAGGSDFAARINAERAGRGLPTLAVRSDLTAAAQTQAERMAARSELFHNPNLAGSVRHWTMLGENVGYGPDVATIHAAFMASTAHRANILNRKYTEVGVGVVVRNHVMWVAEVFRRPTSASSGGGSPSSGGTSKHSGTSGSSHSSSTGPTRSTGASTAHRSTLKAHRPAVRQVRPAAAPPRHAVAVATAAEAWLDGRPVTGPPPAADGPAQETALTPGRPADDTVPTAVFVGLGALSLVLVVAAARVRFL